MAAQTTCKAQNQLEQQQRGPKKLLKHGSIDNKIVRGVLECGSPAGAASEFLFAVLPVVAVAGVDVRLP